MNYFYYAGHEEKPPITRTYRSLLTVQLVYDNTRIGSSRDIESNVVDKRDTNRRSKE